MWIYLISCDYKAVANSDDAILISLTITVNSLSSENIYLHTPIQTDADDREKFCAQKQTSNITFLLASDTKQFSLNLSSGDFESGKTEMELLVDRCWLTNPRNTLLPRTRLVTRFSKLRARVRAGLKTNSAIYSLVRATLDIELKQLRFKRAPFSHRKVLARIVR